MPGEFNHCNLHTQANTQVGNMVLSSQAHSLDLAFNTALTESAGHQDGVHTIQYSQALGLDGKEFKVEERTPFALPPTAKEKNYLLKEVTPEAIVVEWKDNDGKTQSVKIPKGGLPDMK